MSGSYSARTLVAGRFDDRGLDGTGRSCPVGGATADD